MSDSAKTISACLILSTIFLVVGLCIGEINGSRQIRREAIKSGTAIWVADEKGSPEFKWVAK